MRATSPTRRPKPSEEGYILVIVMFMLALLIIAMAVALPRISADIQRDRELETFRRGMQYRRAVQLYYRKFNRYPPNIDALVKTTNIRFLRKRYIDPITRKDDWKPVMFGQQKTPLAMGFFGQPLGGVGATGLMGAGVGSSGTSIAGPTSLLGSGTTSTTDPTSSASSTTTTDPTTGGTTIAGTTTNSGTTFGGAGIVGFSPASPKQSILVYKKKNHYNEWEFTYSPLSEMGMISGGNTNTGITNQTNTGSSGVQPTSVTTQ